MGSHDKAVVGWHEEVIRWLKKENSPVIAEMQIYRNFVRPHESLNGETPATTAGIKVMGENKWITLIQNAKKGCSHI
jgi:hypothetical protein